MPFAWVCGLQATLRHTACIVRTRTHCTAIVPYSADIALSKCHNSAIIEAIYACTNALITNNPFAFDTFGLQFLGGNTLACQESLYFRVFGSISFGYLTGAAGREQAGSRQGAGRTPAGRYEYPPPV